MHTCSMYNVCRTLSITNKSNSYIFVLHDMEYYTLAYTQIHSPTRISKHYFTSNYSTTPIHNFVFANTSWALSLVCMSRRDNATIMYSLYNS